MQAIATDLLNDFAQGNVELVRDAPAATDPSRPWDAAAPSQTTYSIAGAVTGVSARFVDGTTILSSDQQIVCAVPPVVPDPKTDHLVVDGADVTILQVTQIPAAGTPVAFRMILRR